jgi:hypothetical protein
MEDVVVYVEPSENLAKALLLLEKTKPYNINQLNWENFPYKPTCHVHIGWNEHYIYLLFKVQEKQTLAQETALHGNVSQDSCVEFFVSFDDRITYYNFEFNAIGSMHVCYRNCDGTNKIAFTDNQLAEIETLTSFEKFTPLNVYNAHWQLGIGIPATLFNNIDWYKNSIWANFYKCGDKLQEPHYLSWKPIISEKPKFHLPQFFGALRCV